ncbi:hypothetical protein PR202_gb17643 [Eleusine coracana subsp. coracana]|uniref:Homeodomain-like superfamily protein n=1 Tax=Eleusine coracana subsp. coracana TaxID=191504 RepID=A0AAV5F2V1_ELECO|nr:hypothetical protein PR202_gb17643 [Eleusine coracana subsp. coracana]
MDADDDVEEDDMDFNPFLREGSPSETSSSLTSEAEAECEEHCSDNQPSRETYQQNSPGNENANYSALPQNSLLSKPISNDVFVDKSSTQVNYDKNDGSLNVLEKEVLPNEAVCSPTMQNSDHLLLKESEEDAICRRTRARYSLENYSLEELETFLQESDDDGDLQNVDEEEEYRKFLAAVLSGGSDDTVACQGDENQDEDENDADFELEIEEALESDGDENAENDEDTIGRKEKDGRRPQTRQRRPFTQLSGAGSHRHESTKTHLKHILPYVPPALLNLEHAFGWQYPSQNALYPSSLISATCTPLHLHSSSSVVSSESSGYKWVPLVKSPIISILDVSPLQLALGYLSDIATAVVKHRRSHVDGTADKNRKKEPLFPLPVIDSCKDANNASQDRSNNVPIASFLSSRKVQQKKSLAATLVESAQKEMVALVPSEIARLAQRFFPLFNFSLFPHKPPPSAMASRVLFTDAEDRLLAFGLMEYNNDWGAIQKRFLPCKSTHQIFVRQKNRSSSKAPDNPVKGLKMFKNDWTSVWRFVVPHRDPSLLQRQWRAASGLQKSYNKSEAAKEKRRSYEAKRRKLKASMPDSRVIHEQEVDNNSSDGIENDDDSYVNEAFLEDTDRSLIILPSQLSLPGNAGKSMVMQSGTGHDKEYGATGSTSTGNRSTVNANTIDFHPLLQRTEIEMHEDVCEDDYLHSVNQSECNMREAQVDDQSIAVQASRSPCQRENNIDLNINLCSPMEFKNANDFRDTVSKSNVQDIGCRKGKAGVSELEVVKACPHHCIEEPNEESMQGIVMEQEELSDSEEDSQHVEFECEEMDDSEEEQVQGMEASLIQNKSTSASVVCGDFHGCNVQSHIQRELDQVGKQGASLVQKLQGSSRSARAKLKPETVKRTVSRANQRLPTSRTGEPSRTKSRSSKVQQDQSSVVRRSSDSRRTRKNPAPS